MGSGGPLYKGSELWGELGCSIRTPMLGGRQASLLPLGVGSEQRRRRDLFGIWGLFPQVPLLTSTQFWMRVKSLEIERLRVGGGIFCPACQCHPLPPGGQAGGAGPLGWERPAPSELQPPTPTPHLCLTPPFPGSPLGPHPARRSLAPPELMVGLGPHRSLFSPPTLQPPPPMSSGAGNVWGCQSRCPEPLIPPAPLDPAAHSPPPGVCPSSFP